MNRVLVFLALAATACNNDSLGQNQDLAENGGADLTTPADLAVPPGADLASGNDLPMGTPFDTFSAAAHTANARGGFAENRQRLKKALERHGFVNYEKEWWHFSYDVENPVRFDRVIH